MSECKNSTKNDENIATIITSFNNSNEEKDLVEDFQSCTKEDDGITEEEDDEAHGANSEMHRGGGRPTFFHTGKVGHPRKKYQRLNYLQYGENIETARTRSISKRILL